MSKLNEQQMFDNILQWQQSGLSQKAWCAQHNLAYSSFHYWYRRFRSQQNGNKEVGGDGFVELLVQDRQIGAPWCELLLANGHKLLFHQPACAELIKNLLA